MTTTTLLLPAKAFGHGNSDVFQEYTAVIEIDSKSAFWLMQRMDEAYALRQKTPNAAALVFEQRVGPLYTEDIYTNKLTPVVARPNAQWVKTTQTQLFVSPNEIHWHGRDEEGLYILETAPVALADIMILVAGDSFVSLPESQPMTHFPTNAH